MVVLLVELLAVYSVVQLAELMVDWMVGRMVET